MTARRLLYLAPVIAIGLTALPLIYLVIRSLSNGVGPAVDLLARPRTVQLLGQSLALAGAVTISCLVIGTAMAWLIVRTDIAGRKFWRVALGLPLALPSYVAAWSWIGLTPSLAGLMGAWLVLTTITYPYVYLPLLAAFQRTDSNSEAVARTLGHSPTRAFFTIVLPQVRPALAGGALLSGLYVLSDFGAVATMRAEVLTTMIFRSYQSLFDITPAAVLAVVLAVTALVIVGLERLTRRRAGVRLARSPQPQIVSRLGRWRYVAALIPATLLVVALGAPAWAMVRWSTRGTFTVDWPHVLTAAGTTLLYGALGAIAILALAFPLGLLSVRRPSALTRASEFMAYAGHALPGIVVGLAVVFFGIRFAQPLYQNWPMLILAYVVLFLSLSLGSVQNAIAQAPPSLTDVARTLGRSSFGAGWSVTLRISTPGVAMGATLVFLTIMKELPATLLLRPTGVDTLATALWSKISSVAYAEAAPYAIAVVLLAAVPTALLARGTDSRLT